MNSGFGRASVASPDTVTGPLARSLSALQSGTVRVYRLVVKTWYQYSYFFCTQRLVLIALCQAAGRSECM